MQQKLRSLSALIITLALTATPRGMSYEFCQDTTNTMTSAVSITDYCLIKFALTTFSSPKTPPPHQRAEGLANDS